jgi:DNA polymerase (family 10)
MKNKEIAAKFEAIAALMELLGENSFRINSYHKAARAIEGLAEDIETVSQQNRTNEIPGIGESTAEKIHEYLATGKMDRYDELAAKLPPHLPELMALPGLGPKTAAKLWKEAGITSVADLKQCIEKNPRRLTALEGMGEKKVQQMAQSLAFVQGTGGRMRLGEAARIAQELVELVSSFTPEGGRATRVVAAGSLRRGRETVGDIDLLCEAPRSTGILPVSSPSPAVSSSSSSSVEQEQEQRQRQQQQRHGQDARATHGQDAHATGIIEQFCRASQVARVLAQGQTKGSVLLAGNVQADLRVVPAESFGAALMYFTGSKEHNIRLREMAIKKGLKLNEYGLYRGEKQVAGATEADVYEKLGLPEIAPELREDRGEIEAALAGKLPKLVELSQIRGDFQMHTKASDGLATIEEMIAGCRDRGYRAMAITDHSHSEHQANGLDAKRLAAHAKAIHQAAKKFPDMLVLASCEVDILKDGSLDFDEAVLKELDFVLVSPHAALNMTGAAATDRLLRAIESGLVHCLGHPTGRLINERPGMEIDIDRLAKAAAKHNVALEVNADPARLDLRDAHVRAALAAGARLMINTDAHSVPALKNMHFGVTTARRGWATAKDVINTWSVRDFKQWLKLPRR